jgi:hypothetical protein
MKVLFGCVSLTCPAALHVKPLTKALSINANTKVLSTTKTYKNFFTSPRRKIILTHNLNRRTFKGVAEARHEPSDCTHG